MKIIREKDVDLKEIIDVLEKGGVVIYPTETLYGVGVDATNQKAVRKLNIYKRRPAGKPYSIAVSDISMAKKYVFLNNTAKNIYKTFLPGPVTVISKGKHKVTTGIESESGTLGIRIPDYPLIRNIIKLYKKPITATSANASYKKRPYKIEDILDNLSVSQKRLIDIIINAGKLPHNEPSTVIDTTYDNGTVLRQGDVYLKNENQILSKSAEDTKNIAKELWQKYETFMGKRAIVFALLGEMGSGKTIFTKGLAKAIGINDMVTSPSFNIVNEYKIKKSVYKLIHIDVWRIQNPNEVYDINISEKINEKFVISIEWADKITNVIRKFNDEAIIIWVKIDYPANKKEGERIIRWGVSS